MTDVNLLEYGNDSMQVFDSSGNILGFFADNGVLLGIIIAVCFSIFLLLFISILFFKKFKNLVGDLLK